MQQVAALSGKSFTTDAYAMVDGCKGHARLYCNADNPFLASYMAGKHIWSAPPPLPVEQSFQHHLTCKAAAPEAASACITVPQLQAAAWLHLLEGMQLVAPFPKGHLLLEDASGSKQQVSLWEWSDKRCAQNMLVCHDAAGRPSWQPSTESHGIANLDAHHERLAMLFSATCAGHPCKVLLSNGATANMISLGITIRLHLDVVPSDEQLNMV